MRFEYYVLNWNFNERKIERFNIFNNYYVNDRCVKAVKKYLRAPSKFRFVTRDDKELFGFDALCEEVRRTIAWEEAFRCEYEIAVGDIFTTEIYDVVRELDKYETVEELKSVLETAAKRNTPFRKIDCYYQSEMNVPMITREIIWQYKHKSNAKATN